jgi:hypothetical protein
LCVHIDASRHNTDMVGLGVCSREG